MAISLFSHFSNICFQIFNLENKLRKRIKIKYMYAWNKTDWLLNYVTLGVHVQVIIMLQLWQVKLFYLISELILLFNSFFGCLLHAASLYEQNSPFAGNVLLKWIKGK